MMKKLTLLLVFILNTSLLISFAENDEERVRNLMWGSQDPEFKETKCDPKWKNESAVILYRKYEYNVRKELIINNIFENVYSHSRILLNDKAAVEDYSTFSLDVSRHTGYIYSSVENSVFIGIKVIKPNGSENIIPVDKKLINEIKSFKNKKEIQKVAIPNLEPGDIIDYYIACESEVSGNYLYYGFSPVLYYLSDKYPIQKQKMQMHIMRRCFLSAKSVNGAPELKLENLADSKQLVWVLTDKDRPKMEDEPLTYLNRVIPSLLFQATFVRKESLNNIGFFIDKEDKFKTNVSDDDYYKYLKSYSNENYIFPEIKNILKNFNNRVKKEKNPDVIIKELFYSMREYYTNYNIKYKLGNGSDIDHSNSYYFARIFYNILKSKKINVSISLVTPKWLSDFKDVVMIPQLNYIIRAEGSKPYYFTDFDSYTLIGELEYDYQGTECKYLGLNEKKRKVIATDKIPASTSAMNSVNYNLNVSFDPSEADKLSIKQDVTATGLCKKIYQNSFISINDRIIESDKNPLNFKIKEVNSPKLITRIEEAKKTGDKTRDDNVLRDLKYEYGSENIKSTSFQLIQQGRWESTPEYKSTQTFEINEMISKAGKNIILEAGKLIGSQIELEKKDTARLYDIYISYPKTYEYTIKIAIPQGYKVKGYDKFKFNISNETGEFTSTPTIEGTDLVIKVKKSYANNYFQKEKWKLISNYLNAAQDFRNQKLIFTKDSK